MAKLPDIKTLPPYLKWLLRAAAVLLFLVAVAAAACIPFSGVSQAEVIGRELAGAGHVVAWKIGKALALAAAMLMMIQFALAARFKLLDGLFGLARLLRVHKFAGATAGVLAALHPFVVAAGYAGGAAPQPWDRWPVYVGVGALVLLAVVVCTSLWRVFLNLQFKTWRKIHQAAFVIVAAVSVHMFFLGSDFSGWPVAFWLVFVALYASAFVWVKFLRPSRR